MGKTSKVDKSDDIEIISIGKLYTGPWEKKFWSSSRGKDRYPYPVGYKSVRTQNGITYTMEIVEGLKGPSFTIGSTDGKSCSGSTPDIAWESFQKKSCSKLWHAKRFSCKIDGVEFFGFKNTFVQRLLRELVANIGGTTEQSLLPSNFLGEASETGDKQQAKPSSPNPDLLTYLVKSHIKGKRSRKDKVVSSGKRLNKTHFRHEQEECPENIIYSASKQRDQSDRRSSKLSTISVANEVSMVHHTPGPLGPENLASVEGKEICLPIAEKGMQLDSLDISDHVEPGGGLSKAEERISDPVNHFGHNLDHLLQIQEPIGKSKYYEVQQSNDIIPEAKNVATNVQHDTPVFSDADLYAANTLDHAGDSFPVSSPKENVQVDWIIKDVTINDVAKSDVLVTDSLPEDEIRTTAYYTNSEMCDTDSVGQDIAKSMMTVLLPRAVPLLKTFSRKRKKSAKPSPILTYKSQVENNIASVSMNDSIAARGLSEHLDLGRTNEKVCVPSDGHDAVISTPGHSQSVVPDSFDNDGFQDLLPPSDAGRADQLLHGPCPHIQLPFNVETEADSLLVNVAATDALAPVLETTANSKQARFHCHSIDSIPSTHASTIDRTSTSESIMCRSSSDVGIPEIPSTSFGCNLTENIKTNVDSKSNVQDRVKLNNLQDLLQLFACYVHPKPISMVQLIVKQNEIFTCVKCGYSEDNEDTLFVYKALKNGDKMGCPLLIGHAQVALQISTDVHGRDIAFGRSLLQLTPDGQSLVLLNSIKLPYCRRGELHCSCPACTSNSFECNAVKIVRMNRGYASLLTILKTTHSVCCLLVCEPTALLAAEEDGKLKLWVMNSGWSGPKEDWYLPTFDCMFPSIVELKKVPKCTDLVVGHNGFGEFGIWDFNKRSLISKFSSTGMSVMECIPVSVFRWQRKGEYNKTKALVDEILDATKTWFSKRSDENHIFSPEDKDLAVWLLISTNSDSDSQCYQSNEQEADIGEYWRLALLINNTMITGSVVDAGTAATSFGHGIIGRCDGQVYMWELSTGTKLGNLHSFNGSRVSCIVTDASNSGALGIASEGQLLVYLPSLKNLC